MTPRFGKAFRTSDHDDALAVTQRHAAGIPRHEILLEALAPEIRVRWIAAGKLGRGIRRRHVYHQIAWPKRR